MRLLHLGNIEFAFLASGELNKITKWQLIFEPPAAGNKEKVSQNWHDFYNEVVAFVGKRGDSLKVPTLDSGSFTLDENYLISKVELKSLSRWLYEVKIAGVPRSNALVKPFNERIYFNADGEKIKALEFWFNGEEPEKIFPSPGDAVLLAGDKFFCRNIFAQHEESGRWKIVLETRFAGIQLLEKRCDEKFFGLYPDGTPRSSRLYSGRWRIHRDKIAEFKNWVRGEARSEWAEAAALITTQRSSSVSACEVEFYLEAQAGYRPAEGAWQVGDDRSNLTARQDFAVSCGELHFSAAECGYFYDGENYEALEEWEPQIQCPVVATSPLSINLVESSLKTMLITETLYWKKSASTHLKELASWWQSRVFSGKVGELSGSFLREEQFAEDIYDNAGEVFTRVSRHYRVAPEKMLWNPNFWEGR